MAIRTEMQSLQCRQTAKMAGQKRAIKRQKTFGDVASSYYFMDFIAWAKNSVTRSLRFPGYAKMKQEVIVNAE